MSTSAEIGVFGGSGFYSLLENAVEIKVDTPYGPPSDVITIGTYEGKNVAFLPRHGRQHQWPPHTIPYRANVWAMKSLGVTRIIGPSAVGSLQPHIKPGDFVVCDQFVDRTSGRKDTFYDGPTAVHISSADPYCPELRKLANTIIKEQGISGHERGTNVVIQGPRFSTKAESRWFTSMGWEVISMTQYPEAILALEQELCYVNIALVTDYDTGLVAEEGVEPVSAAEVMEVFHANNERVRDVILEMIKRMSPVRDCKCATALEHARL
ncbi:MAG TPA: S-methyl-5'-thioadenosine phosphorylase [Armatimonadota bacterium]|nr:S-methyl-5'-thioadenosine phosphorylase [Armatimonadota bacterium]HOP80179.1 S-methyl-5'-thioadenosine phosphorylase [Armatimonadota bacterium]HPP75844.1 S-methyl-5'-thioadenosine phosphorylase [Armatimonadota bacterium]